MRLRFLAIVLLFLPMLASAEDGLLDLSIAPVEGAWLTDDLGSTTIVHHPWGAFPDGSLSKAGEGQGRYRIPASAFQDSSTLVFVPYDFKPARPIRVLVHLHGWRGSLVGERSITESQHLRETVLCSGTNTILVVPQGPSNVKSSRFGNLETIAGFTAFLTNLPQVLPPGVLPQSWLGQVEQISVSGHSGGGSPIAKLLWDGSSRYDQGVGTPQQRWAWDRLRTVILFDATYGGAGALQQWWEGRPGRRLKSYYLQRSATAGVSQALAALVTRHPDRRAELRVEALSPDELPPLLQTDAHYSVPWYRLWDALDVGSGRCPWSDTLADAPARGAADTVDGDRSSRGER